MANTYVGKRRLAVLAVLFQKENGWLHQMDTSGTIRYHWHYCILYVFVVIMGSNQWILNACKSLVAYT